MVNQMKKNAVLDTNIFLHWDIPSVDWCKELNADSVDIVICLTVMQELDKKKEDYNMKLADRARKVLSLIEDLDAQNKELRKGVRIVILDRSPKVNWDELGLDPLVEDERIIASILERSNPDDVLVTDDATPRMMARKRGIAVLKLTNGRLPEPKSDQDKELERLRSELNEYKNRLPKVSLILDTGEEHNDPPKFIVKRPLDLTDDKIKEMVSEREEDLDLKKGDIGQNLLFGFLGGIDAAGYNADVRAYLPKYEEYLKAKAKFDKENAGVLRMQFSLYSSGRVPAEDVYCSIEFPEGYQLMEEEDLPEEPREPSVPAPLSAYQRMLTRSLPVGLYEATLPFTSPSIFPQTGGPRVRVNSNIVEAEVDKLQHNFEVKLRTIVVRLPTVDDAHSFEIQYEIHAANLPNPIRGSIPVIIELADNSEFLPSS